MSSTIEPTGENKLYFLCHFWLRCLNAISWESSVWRCWNSIYTVYNAITRQNWQRSRLQSMSFVDFTIFFFHFKIYNFVTKSRPSWPDMKLVKNLTRPSVREPPCWNVLFPHGHCPNSFRTPPPLSNASVEYFFQPQFFPSRWSRQISCLILTVTSEMSEKQGNYKHNLKFGQVLLERHGARGLTNRAVPRSSRSCFQNGVPR